ncbi:hypothetical protein [Arthrobacter sp. NPDC092385]|uniref:hypothetical protein n=1 Tax=Arthrobacter sp. NPDC092385 TaxID=3363943 RepID=UPI00382E1166
MLTWRQNYDSLRWFVETMGRLPRQDRFTWERQCHAFLYLYPQRHEHYVGRLTPDQVALLDQILD